VEEVVIGVVQIILANDMNEIDKSIRLEKRIEEKSRRKTEDE
jgi:hypothetical protein